MYSTLDVLADIRFLILFVQVRVVWSVEGRMTFRYPAQITVQSLPLAILLTQECLE